MLKNINEISLRVPATIGNFGPGFDIFSLALEKPYDEIKVSSSWQVDNTLINIRITGRDERLPTSVENNTAGVAVKEFLKRMNISARVSIEIKKLMASASGLGSSGASASGVVYGLNKLFNTKLNYNEMIDIASKGEIASGNVAHPDNVAGCLLGGFVIIRKTNPMDVVKIDIPDVPIVMCILKKSVRTTRALIPENINLDKTKEQMTYCARVVYAVMSKDIEEIGKAINNDNISEPVRAKYIPKYREVKNRILSAGAYGCNISGGGSSIFAICEEKRILEIANIMKKEFPENEVIITRASNEGVREI